MVSDELAQGQFFHRADGAILLRAEGAHDAAANIAEGSGGRTDNGVATFLDCATGECACPEVCAAGQPYGARSHHHYSRGNRQPCLDGMGYAVWGECCATAESTDGRRLHHF